jgi:hypothetical protein
LLSDQPCFDELLLSNEIIKNIEHKGFVETRRLPRLLDTRTRDRALNALKLTTKCVRKKVGGARGDTTEGACDPNAGVAQGHTRVSQLLFEDHQYV